MINEQVTGWCDPSRVEAFLSESLTEAEEVSWMSHLDECASCRERLQNAAADKKTWLQWESVLQDAIDDTVSLSTTGSQREFSDNESADHSVQRVIEMLVPSDDPEMLGRIGVYEVTGVVGAGGMGIILKGHERSLDRIVAIKVLAPHLATSGAARHRFGREAKAAAAVVHPNVIAIHSVSNEGPLPFLVMPYVPGDSVQQRLDRRGPFEIIQVLRIGRQIAAGLAAAHEQGLVHRDIKPANILLAGGVDRVIITDFGLARAVDDASMTRSGIISGTPQYMSPEQARGESIDVRSDLFSLGSVLYSMCAGHSPFRAETSYGVLHRIIHESPRSIREANPSVPIWLSRFFEQLHAKLPNDRIQSATQVERLLTTCIAHLEQPDQSSVPFELLEPARKSKSNSVSLLVGEKNMETFDYLYHKLTFVTAYLLLGAVGIFLLSLVCAVLGLSNAVTTFTGVAQALGFAGGMLFVAFLFASLTRGIMYFLVNRKRDLPSN
ncbi:serine/threonine-protein kinase [Novipirellula rosea]|uniref:Protein kinase domain-containing protein n=1 Tax=Novipirellula rosea TaxID=1031540 RepID=A0ABP8MRH6_9BACT